MTSGFLVVLCALIALGAAISTPTVTKTYRAATYLPQTRVSYGTGSSPFGTYAEDLNNDGVKDLITCNVGATTVSVLIGNGDGTFATQISYPAGGNCRLAAFGDLDGDSYLDIVVGLINNNKVSVLINNGDGTFAAQVEYGSGASPQGEFDSFGQCL
jgi:FG-GAP-like repeat